MGGIETGSSVFGSTTINASIPPGSSLLHPSRGKAGSCTTSTRSSFPSARSTPGRKLASFSRRSRCLAGERRSTSFVRPLDREGTTGHRDFARERAPAREWAAFAQCGRQTARILTVGVASLVIGDLMAQLRLFLVRHGKAEGNPDRVILGQTDAVLTAPRTGTGPLSCERSYFPAGRTDLFFPTLANLGDGTGYCSNQCGEGVGKKVQVVLCSECEWI
jgi:hypothetical protein